MFMYIIARRITYTVVGPPPPTRAFSAAFSSAFG